ncbi:unnamed protein product [Rodentolepis nana]|uniref:LIM zinc-binding domain-containing protein n=1 Tax=Rodentolepis nana TaxID=102285 RepID=A0A3P7SZN1_RODNA|nr:unnamed protein product [Rodentolepis nana]
MVRSSVGKISPNAAYFHIDCLRCIQCELLLNENVPKCYFPEQLVVLCDLCYKQKTHCAKCKLRISEKSRIFRLSHHVFHDECLTCSVCNRHPLIGERVVFTQGQITCTSHGQVSMCFMNLQWTKQENRENKHLMHFLLEEPHDNIRNASMELKIDTLDRTSSESTPVVDEFMLKEEKSRLLESPRRSTLPNNRRSASISQRSSAEGNLRRQKRIRTSFTPQQNAILHAYFKTVMNPDGQLLEQIAHVTNLPKRVTQGESQSLQFFQWNTGGMSQDKKIPVQKILQTYDVDIFTIMEANISDEKVKYYQFPGYTLYNLPKYRQVASGILTGVKYGLTTLYDLIKTYNPPQNSPNFDFLNISYKTVVLGDFNAHSTRWGYKDTNIAGKEIEDILNSNPLELIYSNEDPATYLHYNGTRTTPDLLLASSAISELARRKIIEDCKRHQ